MLTKIEAAAYLAASVGFAGWADGRLPPDQALFAWSVAGTVVGAVLAGLHMKEGGAWQRIIRGLLCFFAGLIFAPWAIAGLPRVGTTPDWWHAFAASGAGAACAWLLVDLAVPAIKAQFKARAYPVGKQDGRVRLVPLVLLAGLAVLAWFCRDILFLIYIMLTGGFGH